MANNGTFGELFIRDVLRSDLDDDKVIVYSIGKIENNEADAGEPCLDFSMPFGYFARPSNPIPGAGDSQDIANVLILEQPDRDFIVGQFDQRFIAQYGALEPGEVMIYAPGADGLSQGKILLKANGSLNLMTTVGNTKDGKNAGIFIAPSGQISLVGKGTGLVLDEGGDVQMFNTAGAAFSTVGANAMVTGTKIVLGGQSAKSTMNADDMDWIKTQLTTIGKAIAACTPTTAGVDPFTAGLPPDTLSSRRTSND